MNNPVSCFLLRSNYVESIHLALAAVVDPAGEICFSAGDIEFPVYTRSSAKPFQAAALIQSGAMDTFKISDQELALVCASHNGEPPHTKGVQALMEKVGITVAHLACGAHYPYHEKTRREMIQRNEPATALHNNCSGKHTGMLAAAICMGQSLENYIDPQHPVQQQIADEIRRLSGVTDIGIGMDGCSAPVFYLPLVGLARMVQRLASGEEPLLIRQFEAMHKHAYLVGGANRFDTDFMTLLQGRTVAKVGAEGIQTIAIRDRDGRGFGLALKVLDGNARPRSALSLAILEKLGLISADELTRLQRYYTPVFPNRAGFKVGRFEIQLPD